MQSLPIIGILICERTLQTQSISTSYIQAITSSGGIPILIPYLPDISLYHTYLSLCDGFLFCGGNDLNPRLYNQELTFPPVTTDFPFDQFQIQFMQDVLSTPKPVLGICRGMQILNVACGGTLYQDISLRANSFSLQHMQHSLLRSEESHQVTFTSDSILKSLFGAYICTNSYHHQAIDTLGTSLIASGHTSDGIIESIELPARFPTIGVQWHPECMTLPLQSMHLLFKTLCS
ncbi:MAG: gamma-glutamyl-gamma-aminobutyrate hydrolase family protein [Lachnospiraceae bacterium]